jgi:hypothetical protein
MPERQPVEHAHFNAAGTRRGAWTANTART